MSWMPKYDGGADFDAAPASTPASRKNTGSIYNFDDPDDENDGFSAPRPITSSKSSTTSNSRSLRGVVLPCKVARAVLELLDYDGPGMTHGMRSGLENMTHFPDDRKMVDPQVVVYHTINTGTCRIYLREAVQYSVYLSLLALKAKFSLQLSPKTRVVSIPFSETSIKPNNGDTRPEDEPKAQPFGCERALEETLQEADVVADFAEQLDTYMRTVVGELHPSEACSEETLEEARDRVREIVQGIYQPLPTKRARVDE